MNIAPITFGKKFAFNIRDEEYKTELFEKIFNKYKTIVTDNSCKIYNKSHSYLVNNSKYLLSTNTKGNRYFLYMVKDDYNENFCYFIDRKICKGYTFPRVILTKFKFSNKVYNGTLLHGELIKDYDNNWIFIFNDIISYCGKNCKKYNKIKRIELMYKLLETQYRSDSTMDICNFQVKKYFKYNEIDYLVNKFIPQLKYNINGILFNSIYPNRFDILLLKNFTNNNLNNLNNKSKSSSGGNTENNIKNKTPDTTGYFNKPSSKSTMLKTQEIHSLNKFSIATPKNTLKSVVVNKPIYKPISVKELMNKNNNNYNNTEDIKNKRYCNFIIERTEQGIFKLISYVNKNKKVFGYARVNSLDKQEFIINLLSNKSDEENIIVECEYSKKFKKFIPIGKSNNKEPDQYIDVKKFISLI